MFDDTPAARAFIEYLATPEAAEIWAGPRRVLVREPEPRRERLPRPDHGDDRERDRRGRGVPLRPLGRAAVRVRIDRGPRALEALPGLRGQPGRHRRDRPADGEGRLERLRGVEGHEEPLVSGASITAEPSASGAPPPAGKAPRLAGLRGRRGLPRAHDPLPRGVGHLSRARHDQAQLLQPRRSTSSSGSTTTRRSSPATSS